MADAIDRKQNDVGAAHETRQSPIPIIDAAIVIQKFRTGALRRGTNVINLICSAANIKER